MQAEDIETAFKTVDMDKSGEISKRVNSVFQILHVCDSGVEAGSEIPEQEIWIERCELKFKLKLKLKSGVRSIGLWPLISKL